MLREGRLAFPGVAVELPRARPLGAWLRGRRAGLVVPLVVGYCLLSHRLGEAYPFSPLSMFSDGLSASSRIAVRTSGGGLCEVSHFTRWQCSAPLDFTPEAHACRSSIRHDELDRKALEFVRSHYAEEPGTAAQAVTIVRRVFSIEGPSRAVHEESCELAECVAVPVPGACEWTR